jgi:hypothetical protein
MDKRSSFFAAEIITLTLVVTDELKQAGAFVPGLSFSSLV